MTTDTDQRSVVDRLLGAVTTAAFGDDIFANDAVLDATVPGWRFPVTGGSAVRAQFRSWFAHPATCEEVRRRPTGDGEVVEYTVCWEEDGVPFAAHHVHVLTVAGDRIARDHFWCGGRWDAAKLAAMEAALTEVGHA